MKRFAGAALLAALLVSLPHSSAWALMGFHSLGEKVRQPAWPAGVEKLANAGNRINGYFVNANDVFQFAGDTATLNQVLADAASVPDTPVTVILHPGEGPQARHHGDKGPLRRTDWMLNVLCRGWHPDAPRLPEQTPESPPLYVLQVEVWLGGNVTLDALQVPPQFEVRAGGPIGDFIRSHQQRRSELLKDLR